MTARPLVARRQARLDAEAAIDHYLHEAGDRIALGFIDALEAAYRAIAAHPAAGSPRYGHDLNLQGLRSWTLEGNPYLVFYVEARDHVDVWRLLHAHRDIPASLPPPE